MAGRHTDERRPVPSPEYAESNPPQRVRSDEFIYPMLSDLKSGQAVVVEALNNLKDKIEAQSTRLDKIDDLRVAIGKLETSVSHLNGELGSAKDRLDRVRSWMFWAAGAVAVIGILAPLVLARVWPVPTPQSAPASPGASAPARTSR